MVALLVKVRDDLQSMVGSDDACYREVLLLPVDAPVLQF